MSSYTTNYETYHQGIAAYILSKGYEISEIRDGKDKNGKPRQYMQFQIDREEGRRLGDEFHNGLASGNLKNFYDRVYDVRNKLWMARTGGQQ